MRHARVRASSTQRSRRIAVLTGAALLTTALAVASSSSAVAAPSPVSAASEQGASEQGVSVQGAFNQGASVQGMTEYLAADAVTNGTIIGPDYTQGQLATEAVGRRAVQLAAQGQYVQFTLTRPANAFDLSYALSQGASGTLSVYVNRVKLTQELNLTSAYSYVSTPDITGSLTHHFFNDVRMLLPRELLPGSTVTFEVSATDKATPYTIDVADFFQVQGPSAQPWNSVSVTSYGADPTGKANSAAAFNAAIAAADSAGKVVWVPVGTYLVSSPLDITAGAIEGAGDWYTQIESNELIDNTSAVAGPINLSGFAIIGSTVGRYDDSTHNAIDGSLGSGWTANGLWIQDTNVGFWLQYGNSDCTVENSVILSTDADGLNFNGNATDCTVRNNFIRNTGDDGLAIWSYPALDSHITFAGNTVEQPNLANGIADYGGSDNAIIGNLIEDTNALGSGLTVSNEQFSTPGFVPLTGTITVAGNTLVRTGALNPNWGHPMCAMQLDAYDYAFSAVTVSVADNNIDDSPWCAYEFVSGSGNGYSVSGVTINGDTVNGTGTVIFQEETPGSVTVNNVHASNIGIAGVVSDIYPPDSGTFTLNVGPGNSGWSTTPVLTAFPSPVTG
jgi:hypothetical protein